MSSQNKAYKQKINHLEILLKNEQDAFKQYRSDMTTLLGKKTQELEEIKNTSQQRAEDIINLRGNLVQIEEQLVGARNALDAEYKARKLTSSQYAKMMGRNLWQRIINKSV
jgi:hypothetical protein